MQMSDDEAAALDEWMAGIETYLRRIDDPLCWPQMRQHAHALRQALVALQVARRRADRVVPVYRITDLAMAHVAAQGAEDELRIEVLQEQVEHAQKWLQEFERVLDNADQKDAAKLEALARSNKKRQEELSEKLELLRPEFEKMRREGLSASRAAEILGERHGVHPDTIRKRLS